MINEIIKDNDNPFTKRITYDDKGYLDYSVIYDRIEINDFAVKEEYRNQQIGSKLLEYLIDYAIKNKMINITLEVKKNNMPAIHLYQKYGFIEVAIRTKYYNGIDGILMEKKLIK